MESCKIDQTHAEQDARARPADIAALAVHLMTNTGATFDIDGGQQLIGK